MSALDKLLEDDGNLIDELMCYLEFHDEDAELPYEEIIARYPKIEEIHLGPTWKVVNIAELSNSLNIPRRYEPGDTTNIGIDDNTVWRVDNKFNVVPRYLGEFKKLEELIIVRNHVFENIIEEIGKLHQLKSLLFMRNRFMSFNQYTGGRGFGFGPGGFSPAQNGENSKPVDMELDPLGKLTKLQNLELINKGLDYMPGELNNLQELRSLNLSWNENMDLTELHGFKKLEHVKITNMSAITIPEFVRESSETLKTLDIGNNKNILLDDVEDFKQLEMIKIDGIEDINVIYDLVKLPNIKTLYVDEDTSATLKFEREEDKAKIRTDRRGQFTPQTMDIWFEENYNYVPCCSSLDRRITKEIINGEIVYCPSCRSELSLEPAVRWWYLTDYPLNDEAQIYNKQRSVDRFFSQ